MANQGALLLKILALSTAISVFIKYGLPYFNLPATTSLALSLVLVPPIVLGIALVWRSQQVSAPQPSQAQLDQKRKS